MCGRMSLDISSIAKSLISSATEFYTITVSSVREELDRYFRAYTMKTQRKLCLIGGLYRVNTVLYGLYFTCCLDLSQIRLYIIT